MPPKRRRVQLSCSQCRLRKVKCDRRAPCTQCRKAKLDSECQYIDVYEQPSVRPEVRFKPIVTAVDYGHKQSLHTPTSKNVRLETGASNGDDTWSRGHPSQIGPESTPDSSPPHGLPKLPHPKISDDELSNRIVHLNPLNFHGSQGKTAFYGRSHWQTTNCFLEDLIAQREDYPKKRATPLEYRTMKILKRELYWHERHQNRAYWHLQAFRLCEHVPERRLTDILLALYLATFEHTLRVHHVPQLLREYDAYWEMRSRNPTDMITPNLFAAKLLAIIVCVSPLLDDDAVHGTDAGLKDKLLYNAQGYICAVRSWLSFASNSGTRRIDLLQIKCTLFVARQAVAFEGDLVHITSGELIRQAMVLGLHRDPSHFPKLSVHDGELRRRLWATIVELELQSSLCHGTPPTVDLADHDTQPPLNIHDEDILPTDRSLPTARSSSVRTRSSFLLALVASLPARLKITKLVNGIHFRTTHAEAAFLSKELTEKIVVPPPVPVHTSHGNGTDHAYNTFQAAYFELLTTRFLIVLHRPFALNALEKSNASATYSRKVCLESSLSLLSVVPPQDGQMKGKAVPLPLLLRMRGGMFREELTHAALSVCIELITQAGELHSPSPPARPPALVQDHDAAYRDAILASLDSFLLFWEDKVRVEKQACRAYIATAAAIASARSRLYPPAGLSGPDLAAHHVAVVAERKRQAVDRCVALLFVGHPRQLQTASEGPGAAANSFVTLAGTVPPADTPDLRPSLEIPQLPDSFPESAWTGLDDMPTDGAWELDIDFLLESGANIDPGMLYQTPPSGNGSAS